MKKLRILMILSCLAAAVVPAMAQAVLQRKPETSVIDSVLKQHMKKELRFTTFQIDSVLSIQKDFEHRNAELENDQNSSEDDINIQIKSLHGERRTKMKAILTAYQLAQFDSLYERVVKSGVHNRRNN
jgi:hypothetical protein